MSRPIGLSGLTWVSMSFSSRGSMAWSSFRASYCLADFEFSRRDFDNAICRRIADRADGGFTRSDGVHRVFVEFAQHDHALVRHAQMFDAAVANLPLTFLGGAVLIAARQIS